MRKLNSHAAVDAVIFAIFFVKFPQSQNFSLMAIVKRIREKWSGNFFSFVCFLLYDCLKAYCTHKTAYSLKWAHLLFTNLFFSPHCGHANQCLLWKQKWKHVWFWILMLRLAMNNKTHSRPGCLKNFKP